MELDKTSKALLRKMLAQEFSGGRHSSEEALSRGFPSHEKGNVKKSLKKLVKLNLIIPKPTGYGKHYSLNHSMIGEIEKYLE